MSQIITTPEITPLPGGGFLFRGATEQPNSFLGSNIDYYCNRAQSLTGNDELEKAIIACANFLNSLQVDSDFSRIIDYLNQTYIHLGNTLVESKQYQKAEPYYHKSLQINPRSDQAVKADRKAIKLQPDLPRVYEKVGAALQQQMRLYAEEAVNLYRQAIQQNPEDVELYHKALEIQPNNAELYLQLCQLLVIKNELDEAIIFYNMGLQADSAKSDLSAKFDLMELGNSCYPVG
ncbi:tetratricopeptide repeat protein [Lyngbya sp. PCC 8106]|uniref:tetratricopeptide repeat protein n=1 Tax=Lyngbya sp. (strain PCC 8106) TaxID=313612 RepID=UPI0000EAB24B|nr:tetratricopeptide repeat protein [Lyngbya sp. PCC 8106]EAW39207.1 TPR repeat protein [Lyngbya sp. PCC 8106]